MECIRVEQPQYPADFALWQTEIPDDRRLQIVNESDFEIGPILKGIGINESPLCSSFGIADTDEITGRLALMRFLHENPALREGIAAMLPASPLPLNGREFIDYFDHRGHNPHWARLHKFLRLISDSRGELPHRMRLLKVALERTLGLEATETALGKAMCAELVKVAAFEGVVSLTLDAAMIDADEEERKVALTLRLKSATGGGHRLYTKRLDGIHLPEKIPYPRWTSWWWLPVNWFGIGRWARRQIDVESEALRENARKVAYKDLEFDNLPYEVTMDLIDAVAKVLHDAFPWNDEMTQLLNGAVIHTHVTYSHDGMRFRILDIAPQVEEADLSDIFPSVDGFPDRQRDAIWKVRDRTAALVHSHLQATPRARITAMVEQACPDLFKEVYEVRAPRTDDSHRWVWVATMGESEPLRPAYRACNQHRRFFDHHLGALQKMVTLLRKLQQTADRLRTTLCFPKFVSDGHIVSFEKLLPVQLLQYLEPEHDAGHIVPITGLSSLNGQLVGLTGWHDEGKTETGLAVATLIYLAQSGLPVFGRGVKLNVKRLLGLVFLEERRGRGSTIANLVRKIGATLRAIENVPGSEIVLIIDELGSATQEGEGFRFGLNFLRELRGKGASVIFTTQITRLAEEARSQLGVQCFALTEGHRIVTGIRGGNLARLARREGIGHLVK